MLARQAAEAAAAKARQSDKGAADALTQGDPRSGTLFTLSDVALLKPRMEFRLGPSRQYQSYVVPDTLVEYPRPDFADQLLTLKDSKQTLVQSDRPEANWYVAVFYHEMYLRPGHPGQAEPILLPPWPGDDGG